MCDRADDRIQVFTKTGALQRIIPVVPGTGVTLGIGGAPGLGTAGSAWDLAFSNDDMQTYMFEADGGNEILHIMDRVLGTILAGFGAPGLQAGQFTFLHSVVLDSKGNLYTGETINGRRIQKFMHVACNNGNGKRQRQRQLQLKRASAGSDSVRPFNSCVRIPASPAIRRRLTRVLVELAGAIPNSQREATMNTSRFATCGMGSLRLCHRLRAGRRAHEFKLDAVINAFVRIEPGEAQLVVRAPLYLFKSAKFPVNNIEIDVDKSAPAIERALAAIQQDITLFENGRPLVAVARDGTPVAAVRSLVRELRAGRQPRCRAARAAARASTSTRAMSTRSITYPIGSPSSVFAIRTTAGPELGDYLKLALRYYAARRGQPGDGDHRAARVRSRSTRRGSAPPRASSGSASRTS